MCVVINFRSDSDALPSSQAIVLTADVLLHVVLAHVARNLPTGVSVQAASPTTVHSATTMIAVSRFLLSRFRCHVSNCDGRIPSHTAVHS